MSDEKQKTHFSVTATYLIKEKDLTTAVNSVLYSMDYREGIEITDVHANAAPAYDIPALSVEGPSLMDMVKEAREIVAEANKTTESDEKEEDDDVPF